MMTMVVKIGGLYGSDEHFYASCMFLKRNIVMHSVVIVLRTSNSTWGMLMKNK
jgi:hypothetical protein